MKWITRFLLLLLIIALSVTFWTYDHAKIDQIEKIAGVIKPLESKTLSFSPEAYEHFGEGILGSESNRYKKLLQNHLKPISLNDRKDLSKHSLMVSYKDKSLTFNDKEEYLLSKISKEDFSEANHYLFKIILEAKGARFCIYHKNYPSSVVEFSISMPTQAKGGVIGSYKLDPYLLVRQKACWLGQDLFLKKYGGEEFLDQAQSERLDFMQESPYSVFVKKGDLLSWKNDQWQKASDDSQQYPLMEIAKIEDQKIHCQIWDVLGIHKEQIVLNKSTITPYPTTLSPLKFMGAKAKRKWLIKMGKMRLSVEPEDWIVHKATKWEKLDSIQSVDQYIGKIGMGELFIVKELKEQNGKKYLIGELFNTTRSNSIDYTLELSTMAPRK